mgnify:CR=1 FL=1
MAEFKKHMMYGDGKSKMANTKKQHLNLKAKGWGHTKPKSGSPLEINQTLVAGARGSNYQYGGETSLSAGEWKGNLMTQPIMDAMLGKQLTEEEQKKANNTAKTNTTTDTPGGNAIATDGNNEVTSANDEFDDFADFDEDEDNNEAETKVKVDVKETEEALEKAKESGDKKKVQKYTVKLAKEKRTLKNLFSKRKLKKRYTNNERALMAAQGEKGSTYNQSLLSVKMPDGSTEEMNRDQFDALKKEQNLLHRSGSDSKNMYYGDFYENSPANARQTILGSTFKRKNTQGNSPYAYKERIDDNTPFYQVEDYNPSIKKQEAPMQKVELPEVIVEGNVFDLMQRIGPIDSKGWVAGAAFIGDEKPPQLLGSSAILGITNFMKTQKDALDEIKKTKGADSDGLAIINNVRALSTNMNKVGTFVSENIDAIDQENESKGSSVANSYLRDIVLTQKTDEEGKPLTTMMVDNNNELAIKFMGTKGVHSLKSIKKDIFPKAYDSFETLAKGMNTVKLEATSGAPFNKDAAMALINNAIKTEQQILSTIHDDESPLHNFLNDFAEQFPGANGDFAIIDSPNYSLEDLEPLVKDYALMKLKAQHALYSKQDAQPSQVARDIIAKYS